MSELELSTVSSESVFVPSLDRFVPRAAVPALEGIAATAGYGPRAVTAAVALAWTCGERCPADAEDTLMECVRRNDLLADVALEALGRLGLPRAAAAMRRCLLLSTLPSAARRIAEGLLDLLFDDGVVAWDDDVVLARDLALRALARCEVLWAQDTGFLARRDLPTLRAHFTAMAGCWDSE